LLRALRFEEQALTSFSGLVPRLRRGFRHRPATAIYPLHRIVLLLVVHLLLGFRCLRESRFYADDPMVKRVLGLVRLPDVATISRQHSSLDEQSVERLEALRTELVLDRLAVLPATRLTLDFDGSVLGTGRRAEGAAVGFNKKKGQRSYYPLHCTVAQTGQVFSVLNRSGNVHDSNGAKAFIQGVHQRVHQPGSPLLSRQAGHRGAHLCPVLSGMDSAFCSDELLGELESAGVPCTVSVPFERFAQLKAHAGRPLCRTEERERAGLRAHEHLGGQPGVHVGGADRPQSDGPVRGVGVRSHELVGSCRLLEAVGCQTTPLEQFHLLGHVHVSSLLFTAAGTKRHSWADSASCCSSPVIGRKSPASSHICPSR